MLCMKLFLFILLSKMSKEEYNKDNDLSISFDESVCSCEDCMNQEDDPLEFKNNEIRERRVFYDIDCLCEECVNKRKDTPQDKIAEKGRKVLWYYETSESDMDLRSQRTASKENTDDDKTSEEALWYNPDCNCNICKENLRIMEAKSKNMEEKIDDKSLSTQDYDIKCKVCNIKYTNEPKDNQSQFEENLKVVSDEYVLLRKGNYNGYFFYPETPGGSDDEKVDAAILKSKELIVNIITHYKLKVAENGIGTLKFPDSLFKIFEDRYGDKVTVRFEGKKSQLFFNIIFLVLNYIKEVLTEVRKNDTEERAMYFFRYNFIEDLLNYTIEIFCQPDIILRDRNEKRFSIVGSRLFLQRILGIVRYKEETYKCSLKRFLLKNIVNSKISYFSNNFSLEKHENEEISCDLIERILQAIDLHYEPDLIDVANDEYLFAKNKNSLFTVFH